MNFKKSTALVLILTFMFSIVYGIPLNVKAASNSRVYFTSDQNVVVGQDFNIYVNADNLTDLYGASIEFCYDDTILQINSVQVGSFYNGKVQDTDYTVIKSGPANGQVSIDLSLLGTKYSSGLAATTGAQLFVIKAKALKASTVSLKPISDYSSSLSATGNNMRVKLADSNGDQISGVSYESGNIVINQYTFKHIEEDNANITYTGTWVSDTNSVYSAGKAKYTSTPASALSFNFTGTGINLYTASYSNRGIAKVTIDGISYNVDTYSSTLKSNNVVFQKADLVQGSHSIKIEYTGTKNSAASSSLIVADSFDIINGDISTLATVKHIEEDNANITYTGTWISDSSSVYSAGKAKYTSTSASALSFNFTGTGINLYTASYSNRGIAKVTIDGISYNVDMYTSTLKANNLVFQKADLVQGSHSIKIEFTGTKNSAASSSLILADSFDIINGDIK